MQCNIIHLKMVNSLEIEERVRLLKGLKDVLNNSQVESLLL